MNIDNKIEELYPKFNKIEKNNPLKFGDKINKWTILYRTNNASFFL